MKRILCFISLLLGIIAVNAQNIAEIEAQADKWAEKSYTRSNALSAYLQCIKQTNKKEVHIRIMKKTSKILEQATYLFDEEASVVDSIISIISKAHPRLKKGNQYYISLIEQRILSRSNTKDFNQKFTLCKFLIKIDHHIPVEDYGNINWVEEERSSACELITAFYDAMKDELKIDSEAATYLYTGMVTDSGRFRFRSVSGDTMRLAGILLDCGVDTDRLYAHLYMKDFAEFKFQGYVLNHIKITENGVAYLHIDTATMEKYGLSFENIQNGLKKQS